MSSVQELILKETSLHVRLQMLKFLCVTRSHLLNIDGGKNEKTKRGESRLIISRDKGK